MESENPGFRKMEEIIEDCNTRPPVLCKGNEEGSGKSIKKEIRSEKIRTGKGMNN